MINKTPANTPAKQPTKRKPGRPRNPPKKLSIDPLKPMPDPKEEQYANFIAQKMTASKAYQIAINPKSPKVSAASRASALSNRPDLALRIKYLQATDYAPKHGRPYKTPPAAPPAQPQAAPKAAPLAPGQLITRADLEAIISAAVREASTATEKTQAVKLARDMLGLDRPEDAPVDPVALLDYITRTAGRTPAAIAKDTGGLRWMLDRITSLSRLPRSQVLRTARAWVRSLAGETEEPDTPPDAAPDEAQPTQ